LLKVVVTHEDVRSHSWLRTKRIPGATIQQVSEGLYPGYFASVSWAHQLTIVQTSGKKKTYLPAVSALNRGPYGKVPRIARQITQILAGRSPDDDPYVPPHSHATED
jgi:hypothetical protein